VAVDEVSLQDTENHSVILSSGSFSSNLFGLTPEDYPAFPKYGDCPLIAVNGRLLADAINKTIGATMAGDDTYNLSGVNFVREDDEDGPVLRLVSTDTQRLTLATVKAGDLDRLNLEMGVIVPVKGLQELRRMTEDMASIELGVAETMIVAKTDWSLLVTRLLKGPFPDYRVVLPLDNDLHAWFDRKEVLDALRRVNSISGKHSVAKFIFREDLLTISAMNPELGQAEESIRIQYDGPEIITGFNPTFHSEILATMSSEKVRLSMKAEKVSYLVTGAEDPGFMAVLVSSSISD
jgi:DNA polymerase-3 subunit beta